MPSLRVQLTATHPGPMTLRVKSVTQLDDELMNIQCRADSQSWVTPSQDLHGAKRGSEDLHDNYKPSKI